jgi:hypothetical protein
MTVPFWTVVLSLADCPSTMSITTKPSTGYHHKIQGRCIGRSRTALPAVTSSMSASARIIGSASAGEVVHASAMSATEDRFIQLTLRGFPGRTTACRCRRVFDIPMLQPRATCPISVEDLVRWMYDNGDGGTDQAGPPAFADDHGHSAS